MFSTIQLDPPWAETGGGGRGAQDQYQVMSTPDILAAIVRADVWRPATDCHAYLWTTMSSLPDGLWLLGALGFRYVTHVVWVKAMADLGGFHLRVGLGQYFRGAHELLLFGVRGNGYTVNHPNVHNLPSVIVAPPPRAENGQRIHSRKPLQAYELIERRSQGPYLEMFARTARPNWTSWGNEAPTAAEGAA